MPGGLRSLLLRPPPPPQPRGSVPPSRRASAAGRPSARAGAPLRLPRARGAEYRPGPVRSDVRSLPPPPARSPWPAGRPRTATATGRSSSGTRRRRSCWAVPGAAGVSAGPGAAGTAARGATPPSPAAGLRRGRGLRAYRGGAGVQVGRAGAGRGGPTLARAPRPWGAFPGIAAAGGRAASRLRPVSAALRLPGGRTPSCLCASPRDNGCPFARPRGGGGSARRCSPSGRIRWRGASRTDGPYGAEGFAACRARATRVPQPGDGCGRREVGERSPRPPCGTPALPARCPCPLRGRSLGPLSRCPGPSRPVANGFLVLCRVLGPGPVRFVKA